MQLLDTNVVSELRKISQGRGDPNVSSWAAQTLDSDLFLSAIVIQELQIGVLAAERRDAAKGQVFRHWLERHVLPSFAGRILPIDTAVALRSASLHVPDRQSFQGALIAATALVHGMIVVTRNTADFSRTGVPLLDPWRPMPSGSSQV